MTSKPTKYTLGHVQFKPNEAGGYTLTDTYKVDPNESFGHEKYKPLRGYQVILGRVADLLSVYMIYLNLVLIKYEIFRVWS